MTATRPLFLYLRAFHSIVPSPVPSFVRASRSVRRLVVRFVSKQASGR